jgi:1-aminocyclopropane-1-carboxylate deaminase/D-cysteine desulfhydrase-like pyridoxal-dependent ACC family enzyme
MQRYIVAGIAALALAGLAPRASAQTTAPTALPPGGLTIGGPGFVHGVGGFLTVWTAHTGVDICATVVAPAGTPGSIFVKLVHNNVEATVGASTSATTLCGAAETQVEIAVSGTVFWRIDRTN